MSQFWYRYKGWIVVIGIFLMLVGLGLLIRSIINASSAPKYPDYKPFVDPNTGQVVFKDAEGKALDPLEGFDVNSFAQELVRQVTESCYWDCGGRCKAYERATQLTDNQLIAVARKFQLVAGKTLRAAMDANTVGCNWGTSWGTSSYQDWDYLLTLRLDRLGL